MLSFVPFSVRMRSSGFVRDPKAAAWAPLSAQWVPAGETVADQKLRAVNARADKVLGILSRFIARWARECVWRRRHAIKTWQALRARQARERRFSFETEYSNPDPEVLSWIVEGSWAAHEERAAVCEESEAKRAAVCKESEAKSEVAQILAMSASEWKACWIERLEVAKLAKTESIAVINWSYAMDALRLQKRLADELLNAPRRVYVGSVFLGMF